jgi:hypothetical protein
MKSRLARLIIWCTPLTCGAVVGLTVMLAVCESVAAESESYREVDGMSVYLGVIPSEIAGSRHRTRAERMMHGGAPSGENSYHVLVSVFDQATGQRLRGLSVKASVHAHGRATSTKPLGPMTVADALTYGNYFVLPGSGEHQITVEILRPEAAQAVRADFTHVVPAR